MHASISSYDQYKITVLHGNILKKHSKMKNYLILFVHLSDKNSNTEDVFKTFALNISLSLFSTSLCKCLPLSALRSVMVVVSAVSSVSSGALLSLHLR